MKPDIAGFAEAQHRLRQELGIDVTFGIPVAPVWPDGTPLDPETGRPYDPTVDPASGGGTTAVTKRVALVFRPIRVNVEDPLDGDVRSGLRRDESIALAIDTADYLDVRNATEVAVGDIDYKVTEIIEDPGPDDRYIAFGEAR